MTNIVLNEYEDCKMRSTKYDSIEDAFGKRWVGPLRESVKIGAVKFHDLMVARLGGVSNGRAYAA
jgi:hypothetical protein